MASMLICLFFAIFAQVTLASVSSETAELCTTKYGVTSTNPVPSTTYALTLTFQQTVQYTSTPVTTVTPIPTTTFVTSTQVTTTSVASRTNVVTSTSTKTDLKTVTLTTPYTVYSTTTTTTILPASTTTVPTPAGFRYPSPPPPPPGKKRSILESRLYEPQRYHPAIKGRASNPSGVQSYQLNPGGTPSYSPARYPTSVVCGDLVELYSTSTVSKTAATTATITAPTSTVTSSVTTLSTSTIFDVSTRFTSTTTTTTLTYSTRVPSTTISTKTITATATPPVFTDYAACAAKNIIQPPPNYYYDAFTYSPATFQNVAQTLHNTMYECCVACITSPYCKVAEFTNDPQVPGSARCVLDYGGSTTSCVGGEVVSVGIAPNQVLQSSLSAGNCGGTFTFFYGT